MTDQKEKLTAHFTVGEMTRSSSHPEIYNVPSPATIANLRRVFQWLERLRREYSDRYADFPEQDLPIKVSSGYRSERLNRAVGGARDSNHLTGSAVDIVCKDCTQAVQYAACLIDLFTAAGERWDELIVERKFAHFWLHFAVRERNNRCHVNVVEKR